MALFLDLWVIEAKERAENIAIFYRLNVGLTTELSLKRGVEFLRKVGLV
jgi:hypothetical protein